MWRKAVLQRDPVCRRCGVRPSVTADHIIPVARGGQTAMENGQGLCDDCHKAKSQAEAAEGRRRAR
ncbi:MAG: HNH endonuclease [Chloroflexi bacterium]|nr:HNH endonuclease [Chloroflexota bacterium]